MDNENILYRFYGAEETLLYVGITNNWPSRLKDHSKRAIWYSSVENIKLERFENRLELENAEANAIKKEKPKYNVLYNSQASPLRHFKDVVQMIETKTLDFQHKDLAWWMVDHFQEEMLFISQYLPKKMQNHRKMWAEAFMASVVFMENVPQYDFSCDLCSKAISYPTLDGWADQVQNAVRAAYDFFDENDETREPLRYGLHEKFAELNLDNYLIPGEQSGVKSA